MTRSTYVISMLAIIASAQPAIAQTDFLATGSDTSVDGYLDVSLDALGSWMTRANGYEDHFNPAGAAPLGNVTWTTGTYIFVDGTEQALLSTNSDLQQNIDPGAFTNLVTNITSPNSPSDTNGDAVNDTVTSAFTVTGSGTTNLGFDLTQSVVSHGPGVSSIQLDYTVTNNSLDASITIDFVRVIDADLEWGGPFDNDVVGTSMHGAGLGTYVYQKEAALAGDPTGESSGLTLSSSIDGLYYGAKQGVEPPNGPPPFAFGTDSIIFDQFGVPETWQNLVANVGYGVNGESGAAPGGDGSIGIQFQVANLGPGQSETFTLMHTYGQTSPISASIVDGDFNDDALWNCEDINLLTAAVASGVFDPDFDMDGDGELTGIADPNDVDNDLVVWLERAGVEDTQGVTNGNPFLVGDANLDGTNDGLDFIQWNNGKFTTDTRWCGNNDMDMVGGNFNGDTVIDGLDFILWNAFKFQSSDFAVAVPEPSALALLGCMFLSLLILRR